MRNTAVFRKYRRGPRGCSALGSAATLTAVATLLATGSLPAQAAVGHHDAIRPDAISYDSTLSGVSTVSATDAWAVGYYDNSNRVQKPLILHWNGTTWTKVKSPLPSGAEDTYLNHVSADSATDAWAVGYYYNSSNAQEPLTLHWNGTAWSQVASPLPSGATGGVLEGVSAVSATDAWATGYYKNSNSPFEPLTLHWNGTAWSHVASSAPSGAQGANLLRISADSATDAWAAGWYQKSQKNGGADEPLLLHWNGTAWSRVTPPVPSGATGVELNSIDAASAADSWAICTYIDSGGVYVALILHWNGTAWTKVKTPTPEGTESFSLNGLSVVSATDAWAAGSYENSSGVQKTLILHWNGKTWTEAKSPAPGGAPALAGVSADSTADAWAVGQYQSNAAIETLILHWNGTTWTKVKSPNGS